MKDSKLKTTMTARSYYLCRSLSLN